VTRFKILSHACLLIDSGGKSVIIDPWLAGSCYWKSWYNFPRAVYDEDEVRSVDCVILSHIHWDHWHGLTIKRYFRDKTFIIPDEPNLRSERDLRALGVKNIIRARHGTEIDLGGGLRLFLYQFGLFLNDAAIVIETKDAVLLNANDAKLAGAPLRHIIRKHGPVDFAFRSHSTANSRICFNVKGEAIGQMDDPEHYARAFLLFMRAVEPRYAVPFASNHCHLHQDTFRLNRYITNPLKLQEFVRENGGLGETQLQIMLPGSAWSSETGFSVIEPTCFSRLEEALEEYRSAEQQSLVAFYAKEDAVAVNEALLERFAKLNAGIPRVFLAKLKDLELMFEITFPTKPSRFIRWRLGGPAREVSADVANADVDSSDGLIRIPAIVFRDAVMRNMFSHARISKRVWVEAKDKRRLRLLQFYFQTLHLCELGVFPLSSRYLGRLIRAYVRRWREVGVYLEAAVLKFGYRKVSWDIEETILLRTK
jgi:UDP-MurNAc hydroxylase